MAFPRLGGHVARHGSNAARTDGRDYQAGIQDRRLDDLLFAGNSLGSLVGDVYDRLSFPTRPQATDFLCFHWIFTGFFADFREVTGAFPALVD